MLLVLPLLLLDGGVLGLGVYVEGVFADWVRGSVASGAGDTSLVLGYAPGME